MHVSNMQQADDALCGVSWAHVTTLLLAHKITLARRCYSCSTAVAQVMKQPSHDDAHADGVW